MELGIRNFHKIWLKSQHDFFWKKNENDHPSDGNMLKVKESFVVI